MVSVCTPVSDGPGPDGLVPEKEKMKETQNINRSLSDVIAALGYKNEREKARVGLRGVME